jgi:cell division protein FtsW
MQGPTLQLEQSFIAFGRGGLTGVGLGQGQQKNLFLPACHTDFVFSSTAEELGFAGTIAILGAFLLILWRGLRTALRTTEPFGTHPALGITLLLVLQSFVNMGVCLGMLRRRDWRCRSSATEAPPWSSPWRPWACC